MPKPVVKSLVKVGISGLILEEFTAVENQNFGEGVELNSRRNQQKRVRLTSSFPSCHWQNQSCSRDEVPAPSKPEAEDFWMHPLVNTDKASAHRSPASPLKRINKIPGTHGHLVGFATFLLRDPKQKSASSVSYVFLCFDFCTWSKTLPRSLFLTCGIHREESFVSHFGKHKVQAEGKEVALEIML